MTLLSVPDMSCSHCKATIETVLAALPDAGQVTVNLASHQVSVAGKAPAAAILAALAEVGYPAEIVTGN